MASHHQRRRRPRPGHLATGAGARRHARRLGLRRPPLSGRPLTVVVCAASLVGLLLTLPSAIRAGQSPPQVAVATSAAPTTLPQTSGSLRTSATRTRPRTAIGAAASTHATTTTTSGRRPSAPAAAAGWVNVVNDQFSSGGVPTHWRRYDGPYGSARATTPPRRTRRCRRLDAPADAARDERPVRGRLVHRRHDARPGLRQRRPARGSNLLPSWLTSSTRSTTRPGGSRPPSTAFPFDDETFDLAVLASVFATCCLTTCGTTSPRVAQVLKRGGTCCASYNLLDAESLRT
jgi:hypothetical protein